MSNDTEKLMRKYPMLSAAWDECSMIWKGIEHNGMVHKFNRKAMSKIVKSEQTKVNDRYIGGHDHMINPIGTHGSKERILALTERYATLSDTEQSPYEE